MTFPSRTTSLIATSIAGAASALAYPFLPQRVATHFDAEGRPDRYGGRAAAALTLPLTMLGLQVFNDRLGSWPGSRDRDDAESGTAVRDEAVGLVELALLPAHLALLANGTGKHVDMSRISRFGYGALMIGLGNLTPKLPRNGLVGIRTPWTLADPTVWERTHRLAGYLLMASGAISLASLPAKGKRAAQIPMFTTLAAVGVSSVYSLIAYMQRPRTKS